MKKTNFLLITGLLFASNAAFSIQPIADGSPTQALLQKDREIDNFLREADNKQNPHSARKEFVTAFEAAQSALVADKMTQAKYPVERLHQFPKPNKYEQSRIYLVDYWYQGKLGNKELESEAAAKLMSIGAGNVDADAYVEAGIRLLKRQYNAQNYGGAIETLGYLRAEPTSQPELDNISSAVKKLDDISASSQDVVQQIKSDDKGIWNTKLLRPTFFMEKINGEVSSIDFNCANKQTTITYKADSVMSTPDTWGQCSIKVNATPNSTFSFVQLAKKPTT